MKKIMLLFFVLILVVSFVNADQCDSYCRDGTYYYDGSYNRETGECEYTYREKCALGCNARQTACHQLEAVEMDCPDYCSDDTHYYAGNYDEESKRCRYRGREVCRYGCNLRQNDCADPKQIIKEEAEAAEKTCRDSDGGRDFEENGTVLWTYGTEEGTLEDHCVGSTLVEYYCDNELRAAAYKECSEEDMLCRDARCVELVKGDCIDPDGDDVTTTAWAEGTNVWNDDLVSWGDYCTETPDGSQTEKGDYVHEAICLETSDGYYEVRYAKAQKCAEGCVDGICVGNGEAELITEQKTTPENYVRCPADCSCMTREAGAERLAQPEMCLDEPCDTADDGTLMYCIKEAEEDAACTDSDGRDIYTKGRIKGWNSDKTEKITSTDYCTDSDGSAEVISGKWLAEEQCDDEDKVHAYYYECPEDYWCSDGRCISRPAKEERVNIRAEKEMKSEIDEKGNLIITKGDKVFNLGNVEELIALHVNEREEIEEVIVSVEEDRPVYNIRKTKRVRLLGFIPVDMMVTSKIDAEKNELIKEKRSWWGFMTTEAVSESNPQPSP